MKKTSLIFLIGLILLVSGFMLGWVAGPSYSLGRSRDVLDTELLVSPNGTLDYEFYVPSIEYYSPDIKAEDIRLKGEIFEERNRPFEYYIFTLEEYQKWDNGIVVATGYLGKNGDFLDIPLTQTGTYFLVIKNTMDTSEPAPYGFNEVIEVQMTLEWTEVKIPLTASLIPWILLSGITLILIGMTSEFILSLYRTLRKEKFDRNLWLSVIIPLQ